MRKGKNTIGNSSQPPTIIVSNSGGGAKIVAIVLGALGLGTGIYYIYKKVLDKKAEDEAGKIGEEANATAASSITHAVNPSGILWLREIDGTNAIQVMKSVEEAIRGGKTFKDISDSYKKLTKGGILEQDMKRDLSASQYQSFLNVIKLNAPGGKAESINFKNPVKKGETLASAAKLTVRKTPYLNGNLSAFQNRGNAIEYIEQPGTFIGLATGNYKTSTSRDTPLADKASIVTVFYEVAVVGTDKKTYRVWVAASLIKVYPKGTRPAKFNRAYMMDIKEYNKAQALNKPSLEGYSNLI